MHVIRVISWTVQYINKITICKVIRMSYKAYAKTSDIFPATQLSSLSPHPAASNEWSYAPVRWEFDRQSLSSTSPECTLRSTFPASGRRISQPWSVRFVLRLDNIIYMLWFASLISFTICDAKSRLTNVSDHLLCGGELLRCDVLQKKIHLYSVRIPLVYVPYLTADKTLPNPCKRTNTTIEVAHIAYRAVYTHLSCRAQIYIAHFLATWICIFATKW